MGFHQKFCYKLKMRIFILVLFLSFLSITNIFSEERENELNKLFIDLKVDNINLAFKTEQKIWKIWSTHPQKQDLTNLLNKGSKFLKNNQLYEAKKIFTKVIEKDPNWPEAWTKRATVLYLLGEFKKSQQDIDKVLELEERHFGALAGQGLVNIHLKNYEKAINSYKKVQEIYPSMKSPEIMIKEIEILIKKQSI